MFITPQKAWRAEELERDLLSSSSQDKSISSSSCWPQPAGISLLPPASNQNLSNKSHTQRFPNLNHNQNKINQRVFTREEVERQMLSDPRIAYQHNAGNFAPVHLPSSMMHPNVMPPVGPASVCITLRKTFIALYVLNYIFDKWNDFISQLRNVKL